MHQEEASVLVWPKNLAIRVSEMRKIYHRIKSKYAETAERRSRKRSFINTYDAILVSYGGSGTTFILKYLAKYYDVNSWDSHNDGIKHANSPNHPIFDGLDIRKAVYIYSDPIQAVLSLFRRDFQSHMSKKLLDSTYADVTQYNRRTKLSGPSFTLDNMLDDGTDYFGINAHWAHWTNKPVQFPTLFIRFENFYQNIEDFFDFLDLDQNQRDAFPPRRERKSSISQHDVAVRRALEEIYGETLADMNTRSPTFIRS